MTSIYYLQPGLMACLLTCHGQLYQWLSMHSQSISCTLPNLAQGCTYSLWKHLAAYIKCMIMMLQVP